MRDQQVVSEGRISDDWYVLYILLEKRSRSASGLVAGERIELHLLGRGGWRLESLKRGGYEVISCSALCVRVLFAFGHELER